MNKARQAGSCDVVMLCGGLGTRLRTLVPAVPKSMASIRGRPFLDLLIDYLIGSGFRRFILCTGYKGAVIERRYSRPLADRTIVFSREKRPLGTGGAIKAARRLIRTKRFLVCNGDSLCKASLAGLLRFHREKKALVSMVIHRTDAGSDKGLVLIDARKRIRVFSEKTTSPSPAYANAGIYLFEKGALDLMPAGRFSLEYDFFPAHTRERLYGYVTKAECIDIGTPERYRRAQTSLSVP